MTRQVIDLHPYVGQQIAIDWVREQYGLDPNRIPQHCGPPDRREAFRRADPGVAMITVLIAAGAGVGGILIGAGWCIWRVSRRFTLQARPVEPVRLPESARAGDVVIGIETRSRNASADYDPPDVREDRGW